MPRTSIRELALLFLRLGVTAFGGPAAHIAMMQDEVVRKRAWLTNERFLDLLSASNLIPGPNSTELALHIGLLRRGWAGFLVAGAAFILPAAFLTAGLGWLYARHGTLPSATGLLHGVKPIMLAIVGHAIWSLGPKAARTRGLAALGLLSAGAAALGVHELAVLFGAGLLYAAAARKPGLAVILPLLPLSLPAAVPVTLPSLFGLFLKTGSVLYGSGYVLLAFLRADLVERLGWLSPAQLLDAIAVGQVTPGPVFTTATFVGYILAGPAGAALATLGIFLPAFVFVALSSAIVPRLRASPAAGAFLDGVNVASLALMVVVTVELAGAALRDVPSVAVACVAAILLVRFKINSMWLVLAGAAFGLVNYR